MGAASPDPATVIALADALWRAEVERRPIDPLSDARRDLTVQDAYAIQSHNIERRVAAGGVVRGRKVGLTSRPMQPQVRRPPGRPSPRRPASIGAERNSMDVDFRSRG